MVDTSHRHSPRSALRSSLLALLSLCLLSFAQPAATAEAEQPLSTKLAQPRSLDSSLSPSMAENKPAKPGSSPEAHAGDFELSILGLFAVGLIALGLARKKARE